MMIDRPARTPDAAGEGANTGTTTLAPPAPAFDAAEFDELREMIGQDGVMEMVKIFETETRQRLQRLAVGNRDPTTLVREMHTLKGAAGTVAAPRLAVLGLVLEQAAQGGGVPSSEDLRAIEDALEAFLLEARIRDEGRSAIA
jgi:HPt (histidine-containing phosphotransfer) domain-containing protein